MEGTFMKNLNLRDNRLPSHQRICKTLPPKKTIHKSPEEKINRQQVETR